MADASRFPQLAFPFALVGAAAGWLSLRMLEGPLFELVRVGKAPLASACAMGFAAATGALLTRLCVGRRYPYEMAAPDPEVRPPTDRWPLQVALVLVAGAGAGASVLAISGGYGGPPYGAIGGLLSALAFVPVCLAVIAVARRAQRARLGSLVARSDRRAVWAILALTLALSTLEVLVDWTAPDRVEPPLPALGILLTAALVTLATLGLDLRAIRRAKQAVGAGLEQRNAADVEAEDPTLARIDLGLGDDLLARVARGASAYRGRDRMTALVNGSPEQAVRALRRAVARGVLGFAVIALVGATHFAAMSAEAIALYRAFDGAQSSRLRTTLPRRAMPSSISAGGRFE